MAYNKSAPFGANIAHQLEKQNALLAMMVEEHVVESANWDEIGEIVRKGLAPDVFSIGDQFITKWKDTTNSTEYTVPLDIVHFGDVTLQDGEVVPGMFLQWHYATPFGVQFDQNEAFYYAVDGLSAGTYNITMGNGWGSNVVNGKTYQFTLTNDVPAKGQLQFGLANSEISELPDKNPSEWRIRTYASATSITPIEIVVLTEGSEGTNLGVLSSSTKYSDTGVNNMQRSAYGYNRWGQSGIRQYLNSDKNANGWWSAKNVFDRPPIELATKNGFLTGVEEGLLRQIKPIKITTALNTVSDSEIGATEDTYDKFFLASKRNENLQEQLANVEGDVWEYWHRATNGTKPADYQNYAAPITYAVENHASAQSVRLRSAGRGYAYRAWYVSSSGNVYYNGATYSYRVAPACVIC